MRSREAGFTLVELVVSIVLISVATAGVLLAITTTIRGSADPQRLEQAVAIAQAYMEEIRLQPLTDPDGGTETRPDFDDIQDYDGLSETPRDQTGTVFNSDVTNADLTAYTVDVDIVPVASAVLGPGGSEVPAADTFRVDVRVRRGTEIDLTVSSYRTAY